MVEVLKKRPATARPAVVRTSYQLRARREYILELIRYLDGERAEYPHDELRRSLG